MTVVNRACPSRSHFHLVEKFNASALLPLGTSARVRFWSCVVARGFSKAVVDGNATIFAWTTDRLSGYFFLEAVI